MLKKKFLNTRQKNLTLYLQHLKLKKKVNLGSDLDVKETYMVGANQYLGRSNAGVGNEVVVRITVDDDKKLKDIEILKQSETGIGAQAIESIPKEMISKNTYDVDSISGASATSRALKEAVKDAMNKI
ncbi:FMN-binding protein [Ligilactobacillus salivarius]|uniref:FMN-binding protein n=1 Tax=Ligilactobacillus salivarius TaxID=1624 RepID=UPI0023AF19F2|nr:FMN-binding protein [Ligilactobacillus salivarius]MDE7522027.1 FMN-binding protein [Ligilactobacillus salivarius]